VACSRRGDRSGRRCGRSRAAAWRSRTKARAHEVRTDHLLTLVDDCGVIQHANGAIPNRYTGYCGRRGSPCNRRVGARAPDGDKVWSAILYRSLAFHAQTRRATGKGMRNFSAYDRAGSTTRTSATTSTRSGHWRRARPYGHPRLSSLRGECSHRSSARSRVSCRCTAAHGTRPRASRCRPPRAGGAQLLARCARCSSSHAETAGEGWLWFGRAQVRQCASVAGVDPRRRGPRPPGGDRDGSGQPRVAR
jgi:hypothetical protein